MKKPPFRFSAEDEKWMNLALAEAAKARGHTSPNPMVGAVLVRNGKLLAKGYHRRAGLPHAEVEALQRASDAKGATLYVTLEPCCHEDKRTPPCTRAILAAGLKRVVVATVDPNPKVAGRGLRLLKKAGLKVEWGICSDASERLNVFYHHWMRSSRPYVLLKAASSLDGRIALKNGKSQWITGEIARRRVHEIRSAVDAVLVGIGTVIADDPLLTARHLPNAKQPRRFVLDPQMRISPRAKILRPRGGSICTVVVSPAKGKSAKRRLLEARGAEVWLGPMGRGGTFDLLKFLKLLGKQGIQSLLVEGGPETWTAFLRKNLAQELWLFLAPRLLGGDAKGLLTDLKIKSLATSPTLSFDEAEMLGSDILLTYRAP